ncbi:MAG: hypothetical protein CSA70_06835 [Rhodobacterales bacterium]|nr:MAG: hypothetical protein CSA70_06835 [Rhodobacterales bacterium]
MRWIFRLLTPWYLRWLFGLPWWLWAVVSLAALTLVPDPVGRYLRDAPRLQQALAALPPALVPLAALTPAAPFGEVRVRLDALPRFDPIRLDVVGPDKIILPLADGTGAAVRAVLVVPRTSRAELATYLQGLDRFAPVVTGRVDGDIGAQVHHDKTRISLEARGIATAPQLVLITPFLDGRRAGLNAAAFGPLDLGISLTALLLPLMITGMLWYRQRAQSAPRPGKVRPTPTGRAQPSVPVPRPGMTGPWGAQPTAPVPPQDPVSGAESRHLPPTSPTPSRRKRKTPEDIVARAFGRAPRRPPRPHHGDRSAPKGEDR